MLSANRQNNICAHIRIGIGNQPKDLENTGISDIRKKIQYHGSLFAVACTVFLPYVT